MKKLLVLISIIGLFVVCSCAASQQGSEESTIEQAELSYTSLSDYLRHKTNITVSGVEPDIRLQIRGMGSVTSDTRPFIYVDKNPIGRDYIRANNYVNANNIKRVEVISSLADLAVYGHNGHAGIIKIYTKSSPSN